MLYEIDLTILGLLDGKLAFIVIVLWDIFLLKQINWWDNRLFLLSSDSVNG